MPEGYGKSFNGKNGAEIAKANRLRAASNRSKRARDPDHVHDWGATSPTDDPKMGKRYLFRQCKTCDATEMTGQENLFHDRRGE